MTMSSDVIVSTVDPIGQDTHSYVDWPAIIAGVVLASAISLVLLTFGSAIGLSFVNFRAPSGVSPVWIAIAAGSWLLWVQISSFMAGGYVTGRLRKRHADATEHEVDVRDGAHGLLVWAGALVVGAIIAVGGIGAAANAIGSAASTLTTAASNVADDAGVNPLDPNAYFVDTLFRPATGTAPAPAPEATAPAASTPTAPAASTDAAAASVATPAPTAMPLARSSTTMPMVSSGDQAQVRGEAGRIFAQTAMGGEVSADDKAYLAQLVAANTGMTQAEASARVDQVMAAMDEAKARAMEAAETARRNTVIAAFLTAASLLVSAIGAFWAAQKGGNHRDQGTMFADVFRRL